MKVQVHLMDGVVLDFAAAMAKGLRVGLLSLEGKIVPFHVDDVGFGDEEFSLPELHKSGTLVTEVLNAHGFSVGPQLIQALPGDNPQEGKPHPCAWECSSRSGLSMYGPTVEIAVVRCFVAEKLGLEVEIPDELLNSAR